MGDDAPSKQYAFPRQQAGLMPLKRSGGAAMMVMNLALPSERFGGFRPAHCQGKAYEEDVGGYQWRGLQTTINQKRQRKKW